MTDSTDAEAPASSTRPANPEDSAPSAASEGPKERQPASLERKSALRAHYLGLRSALGFEQWRRDSDVIQDAVLSICDSLHPGVVLCYHPIKERREVDTIRLMEALMERGWQVCLPRTDVESRTMQAIRVLDLNHLERRGFGVMEPVDGSDVSPQDVDLVILPNVAMDRSGGRLGYGGGFYDRYLASIRPTLIAPCFECCLREEPLPQVPSDRPADWIITENQIIRTMHAGEQRP